MQATVTLPKPLMAVYAIFAFLFAALGIGFIVNPSLLLASLEPSVATLQAGFGFLLAAFLNIFCLFPSPLRSRLHTLLLLFLAASTVAHVIHGGSPWLVLAIFIYALPLLPWAKLAERAIKQDKTPRKLRPARTPRTKAGKNVDRSSHEKGEVKWFNPNKGFGFILAEDGREVFVHFRAVDNGGRRSLQQGVKVSFTVRTTERGEQAEQVFIHR